jgi:hypothetical protein
MMDSIKGMDGFELSEKINGAYKARKIDNETLLDAYAYWLQINNYIGPWSKRRVESPDSPKQEALTIEDIDKVFN